MAHPRAAHTALGLACFALLACDSNVRRPGSSGRTNPSTGGDTGRAADPDAGFPDFGPGHDAGFLPDLGFGFDAGSLPDFGFPARDSGFPPHDSGFPVHDAGFPVHDAGSSDLGFPNRDASLPDLGLPPRDAGFGDGGTPGLAATVSGPSTLEIDFRAGAAEPLRYQTTLRFDNATGAPISVSVLSGEFTFLGTIAQTFAVQPGHLATPGASSVMVSKVPGSGQPTFAPDPAIATIICGLPLPTTVTLALSTGDTLVDLVRVTCIQ